MSYGDTSYCHSVSELGSCPSMNHREVHFRVRIRRTLRQELILLSDTQISSSTCTFMFGCIHISFHLKVCSTSNVQVLGEWPVECRVLRYHISGDEIGVPFKKIHELVNVNGGPTKV